MSSQALNKTPDIYNACWRRFLSSLPAGLGLGLGVGVFISAVQRFPLKLAIRTSLVSSLGLGILWSMSAVGKKGGKE